MLFYSDVAKTLDFLLLFRYMDGEQLTPEDEKLVVERLLAHHPHSQDKIGCGIDSIMVPMDSQILCYYLILTSVKCFCLCKLLLGDSLEATAVLFASVHAL